ncbi:tether containing UBX domain for GLUT4 [Chanos chanos]|uniref:Tether containing UBX domain for GLUT4 n=1 Tax=Chanos chanos TaxID=29144 RepID=A0A6J2V3K9_CHACN|nr:tether containing UBX domain for GLUT4-like [Chanos chanos]
MAASSTAVTVLTPNGRRQTVKVFPNTPLLQVLEDVCKKHGFNPDDHGLKFQRNVLDLTLQWRFASLPNNAKLEVVPSTRQKAATEGTVRVALQLEDGSRLQGSFSSGQSLWELLNHFPQTRLADSETSGSTPVCVYMRDEINGEEAVKKTTLKSLGLTGGSAIIRYVLKKSKTEENEPMETAAMATHAVTMASTSVLSPASKPPLQTGGRASAESATSLDMQTESETAIGSEQVLKPASQSQTPPPKQEEVKVTPDPQQAVRPKSRMVGNQGQPEPKAEPQVDEEKPGPSRECHAHSQTAVPSNFVPFSGGGQRLGGPSAGGNRDVSSLFSSSSSQSSGSPKAKKAKPSQDVKNSARAKQGSCDTEEREEHLEPVDREALVYHLDSGVRRHSNDEELPDEFFEVTVDDVRKRFAQLKSERRMLEETPLMTKALRESQMKEKMDRYPKVVLRVQFPDRHVLQGFFRPLETVGVLKEFVRKHLEDPQLRFYLFIAPPKTILDDSTATLFQAKLFPAALVYFGSDVTTECYLRRELLDSSVSALQADELIAGCMPRSPAPSSTQLSEETAPLYEESSAAAGQQRSAEDEFDTHDQAAPKPVRTDPGKVPKWLKLPGKK